MYDSIVEKGKYSTENRQVTHVSDRLESTISLLQSTRVQTGQICRTINLGVFHSRLSEESYALRTGRVIAPLTLQTYRLSPLIKKIIHHIEVPHKSTRNTLLYTEEESKAR
jgi:hypothetical protein